MASPTPAHLPQLNTCVLAQPLTVFYSSGQRFELVGVYRGPWSMRSGEFFVALSIPESKAALASGVFNEVMMLDPLCVVVDADTGKVLWNPRGECFDMLGETTRAALDANPHWPAVLELGTGEVEAVK